MHLPINYIDKLNSTIIAGWLITLLVAIAGWNYIKNIIVFILTKLYEFFIQHGALKIE